MATGDVSAAALSAVFLDTGPLGAMTQRPGRNATSDACQQWGQDISAQGVLIIVPEIADYEMRRELIRMGNIEALARLDALPQTLARYEPINTLALREAARLWAVLRNANLPTSSKEALDGDAILAGQVIEWGRACSLPLSSVAIVTTNVSDLSRFTNAQGNALLTTTWQEIN